jgi:hypothetical protein
VDCRLLPTRQVATEEDSHSTRELGAAAAGPSHVRHSRPCPRRAPSTGSQRLPTVNSGQLPWHLTCITARPWAAAQCFPSSRSGCGSYVPKLRTTAEGRSR